MKHRITVLGAGCTGAFAVWRHRVVHAPAHQGSTVN
jgi:hypothetical protein